MCQSLYNNYSPDAPKVDIQKELSIAKQPLSETMTTSGSTTSSHGDSIEKKLKKLRKKLKEIDNLKQRRENGENLESNQVTYNYGVACVIASTLSTQFYCP